MTLQPSWGVFVSKHVISLEVYTRQVKKLAVPVPERAGEVGGTSQNEKKACHQACGKRRGQSARLAFVPVAPQVEPTEKGGRAPKDSGARENYFPPIGSNHLDRYLSAK